MERLYTTMIPGERTNIKFYRYIIHFMGKEENMEWPMEFGKEKDKKEVI